jgi:hypothetical protein
MVLWYGDLDFRVRSSGVLLTITIYWRGIRIGTERYYCRSEHDGGSNTGTEEKTGL